MNTARFGQKPVQPRRSASAAPLRSVFDQPRRCGRRPMCITLGYRRRVACAWERKIETETGGRILAADVSP